MSSDPPRADSVSQFATKQLCRKKILLTLGLPWGPMDPKTIFNLMDLLHLLSAGYGTP